jgi:hypothetical protein
MEPSEYVECPHCTDGMDGGEECAICDGYGKWVNPEHEARMKYLIGELLDSDPFLAELENANYHSAVYFLEELRDNEW